MDVLMLQRVTTKATQREARYTPEGGRERCVFCRWYFSTGACGRILGPVAARGWCKYFSRQMSMAANPGGGGQPGSGVAGDTAVDLQFTTMAALPASMTFTRASTATYFNNVGVMQTAAANAPRFDNDPVSHAPLGLLIEESRTNIVANAGLTTGAAPWTPLGATFGATVVAPDGTNTGATLIGSSGTSRVIQQDNPTFGTNTVTLSAWLKAAAPVTARLGLGSSGIAEVLTQNVSVTTQWQRFSITATGTAADTGSIQSSIYCSDGTNPQTINVWGVQAEVGAFPTSYIPTAGAAVTRAVDVATLPSGAWRNSAAETFGAEIMMPTISRSASNSSIVGGTNANIRPIFQGPGLITGTYDTVALATTSNSFAVGTTAKIAAAWSSPNGKICLNGGTIATSAGMTAGFSTIATFLFFDDSSGVTDQSTGYLRRFRYWPRVLSNSEMQQVTT